MFYSKKNNYSLDQNILWSQYIADSEGYITTGKVREYNIKSGEKTEIVNLMIEGVSFIGEDSIIGLANLSPKTDGFKGIIKYNLKTQNCEEVVTCDEIYERIPGENHDFHGDICVNSKNGNLYFICGGYILEYSMETRTVNTLIKSSSKSLQLSHGGEVLYYSEDGWLYKYNLRTKEKEKTIAGVANFAIAKNESKIVYENRKEKKVYLYDENKRATTELFTLNHIDCQLKISNDNNYILYTDYDASIVPGNERIRIYLYDLQKKKRIILYKGSSDANIRSVLWL